MRCAGHLWPIRGGAAAQPIAVLRLRPLQPAAATFRPPYGAFFNLLGLAICLALLTQLHLREALCLTITAFVADANRWWVRRRVTGAAPQHVETPGARQGWEDRMGT